MVAREAMAYGRPVVATAVGGLVDAVEDGVTGVLVPARDVEGLRAALQRLFGDAELRSELGRGARERALALTSPRRYVAALGAAYASEDAAADERAQHA